MARKHYKQLLSQKEVLSLLRSGRYVVNLSTGEVMNRMGTTVTPFYDEYGRKFVRLYGLDKRKAIAVSRLLWMAATNSPIPRNFEIHHRDEDPSNDCWDNLICLHKSDHLKMHNEKLEIPF